MIKRQTKWNKVTTRLTYRWFKNKKKKKKTWSAWLRPKSQNKLNSLLWERSNLMMKKIARLNRKKKMQRPELDSNRNWIGRWRNRPWMNKKDSDSPPFNPRSSKKRHLMRRNAAKKTKRNELKMQLANQQPLVRNTKMLKLNANANWKKNKSAKQLNSSADASKNLKTSAWKKNKHWIGPTKNNRKKTQKNLESRKLNKLKKMPPDKLRKTNFASKKTYLQKRLQNWKLRIAPSRKDLMPRDLSKNACARSNYEPKKKQGKMPSESMKS